jgi:hypothetical protein
MAERTIFPLKTGRACAGRRVCWLKYRSAAMPADKSANPVVWPGMGKRDFGIHRGFKKPEYQLITVSHRRVPIRK